MVNTRQLIIIICLAFGLSAPVGFSRASAPPDIPLLVYGEVKINGLSAPAGTLVKAFNNGREITAAAVAAAGKYSLEISAANIGASVTYKIGDLIAVSKIAANPLITPSERIDLAVSAPAVNSSAPASGASGGSSGGGSSGGGSSGGSSFSSNVNAVSADTSAASSAAAITPTLTQVLGVKITNDAQLEQILTEASVIWSENLGVVLANAGALKDAAKEKHTADNYLSHLAYGQSLVSAEADRLKYFIAYGTAGTKILGAGERAGVLGSYKSAFGKLPKLESDWQDVIKIANGRWPGEKNIEAESRAGTAFKKIYLRGVNLSSANDNAAITIMAYGLRPIKRNFNSEKAAIKSFKAIFRRAPTSALDWDIIRAIAYSGAKR